MLDPDARKRLLRSFTYGLYWVSAEHEGERGIFTANWVSQASFAKKTARPCRSSGRAAGS
jgi:flavin reductase (DIM6/NTAB) family NADH-FMN oxidoreductase RutF